MADLLSIIISNTFIAAALAVFTLLVTSIWRSPPLKHALWLLVLVKLITPPIAKIPVPQSWFGGGPGSSVQGPGPDASESQRLAATRSPRRGARDNTASPDDVAATIPTPPSPRETRFERSAPLQVDRGSGPLSRVEQVPIPVVTRKAKSAEPSASATPTISPNPAAPNTTSWTTVVSIVWAAVSSVCLGLLAWRCLRFQRILKASVESNRDILESTARLAAKLGIRKPPRVRTVNATVPPLVWSLGLRPVILLPQALLAKLEPAQRDAVIAHELAHIKRRDDFVRWLEVVVLTAFWWNPVAWFARRKLREAEEECCDAWVVWALPDDRRSYGQAMMKTIDFLTAAPAVPAPAGSTFGRTFYKRRIEMIMKHNVQRRLSWTACGTALMLAALVLPVAAAMQDGNETKKDSRKDPSANPKSSSGDTASTNPTKQPADKNNSSTEKSVSVDQLLEQIQKKLAAAVSAKNSEEITRRTLEARKLAAEAVALAKLSRDNQKRLLGEFPLFIPASDKAKFAARRQAETQYISAQLTVAKCMYTEAQTHNGDAVKSKELFTKTVKEFEQIHNKYRSQVAGLYAKLHAGKCYQELGELRKARGIYQEIQAFRGAAKSKSLQQIVKQADELMDGLKDESGAAVQPKTVDILVANFDPNSSKKPHSSEKNTDHAQPHPEGNEPTQTGEEKVGPGSPYQHDPPSQSPERKLQERLLTLDLDAAKVALESAKDQLTATERARAVGAPGVISEREMANIKSNVRHKEIELERAKTNLALFKLQSKKSNPATFRSKTGSDSRQKGKPDELVARGYKAPTQAQPIYNDKLKRFKFKLEKAQANDNLAVDFLVLYKAGGKDLPELLGIWTEKESNSLVVLATPEAEQEIRNTLARLESRRANPQAHVLMAEDDSLEGQQAALLDERKAFLTAVAEIELTLIEEEDKGDKEKLTSLKQRMDELSKEVKTIDRKLEVIGHALKKIKDGPRPKTVNGAFPNSSSIPGVIPKTPTPLGLPRPANAPRNKPRKSTKPF